LTVVVCSQAERKNRTDNIKTILFFIFTPFFIVNIIRFYKKYAKIALEI